MASYQMFQIMAVLYKKICIADSFPAHAGKPEDH